MEALIYDERPKISGTYHVNYGEDVTYRAAVASKADIYQTQWQKVIDEKATDIDISNPKYSGSSVEPTSPVLVINQTDFTDEACYQLVTINHKGEKLVSNKISLQVSGGIPTVEIDGPTVAEYGSTVTFGGEIRSLPDATSVTWIKFMDGQPYVVDESIAKYSGSSVDFINPTLVIHDVNFDDEGEYQLEVINELGHGQSNKIWLEIEYGECERIATKTTISIEVKNIEKKQNVERMQHVTCDILNQIAAFHSELSCKEDITAIVKHAEENIESWSEADDNTEFGRTIETLYNKARQMTHKDIQKAVFIRIVIGFTKHVSELSKKYHSIPKFTSGSICIHMLLRSSSDFEKYQEELRGGDLFKDLSHALMNQDFLSMFDLDLADVGICIDNDQDIRGTDDSETLFQFQMESRSERQVVAAIDIGSSYSGVAYSYKIDWKDIHIPLRKSSRENFPKVPTILLLNPDQTLNCFGFEAEYKYLKLVKEGRNYKDYYYFHKFMKEIYKHEIVDSDTLVEDDTGKKLRAIDIVAHSVSSLVGVVMDTVHESFPRYTVDDVCLVLMVYNKSDDAYKKFIWEAAISVGMKKEQIIILPDSQAVSLYFLNTAAADSEKTVEQNETQFIVLDTGDTSDITLHTLSQDQLLGDFVFVGEGPWGGKSVDRLFLKFMSDVCGKALITDLKSEFIEEYFELYNEFENIKRNLHTLKTGHVHMKIPLEAINSLMKTHEYMKKYLDMYGAVKSSKYADSLRYQGRVLSIDVELFKSFFRPSIDGIIDALKPAFQMGEFQTVRQICMIGGFSGCRLLQKEIRKNFKNTTVVTPIDPDLVVLKCAVTFGHIR